MQATTLTQETSFLYKLGAPRRAYEERLVQHSKLQDAARLSINRKHARREVVDLEPYRDLFTRREIGQFMNKNFDIQHGHKRFD
jgi:hypothetical protein